MREQYDRLIEGSRLIHSRVWVHFLSRAMRFSGTCAATGTTEGPLLHYCGTRHYSTGTIEGPVLCLYRRKLTCFVFGV